MGLIRFLLALSVIIVHSSPLFGLTLLPGYVAVQSFYIISGFYMAMVYREKYLHTERTMYGFYTNRFLRLYPLYILVVLLILIYSVVVGLAVGEYGKIQFYVDQLRATPAATPSLLVIGFFNLTLIGQDWLTFFGIGPDGALSFLGLQQELQLQALLLIPIAWTVAVEIFFYAFVPWLTRASSWRRVWMALLVVLALRLALYAGGVTGGFAIYRFAPTEMFWFLLGILSYYAFERGLLPGNRWAVAGFVALLAAIFSYPWIQSPWVMFVLVTIFTPAIFRRFSQFAWDRWLGEMTYPMYISHLFLILIVVANHFPKPFGTGVPLAALTLLFSVVVYYSFIRPLERYRSKRIHVQPQWP